MRKRARDNSDLFLKMQNGKTRVKIIRIALIRLNGEMESRAESESEEKKKERQGGKENGEKKKKSREKRR